MRSKRFCWFRDENYSRFWDQRSKFWVKIWDQLSKNIPRQDPYSSISVSVPNLVFRLGMDSKGLGNLCFKADGEVTEGIGNYHHGGRGWFRRRASFC